MSRSLEKAAQSTIGINFAVWNAITLHGKVKQVTFSFSLVTMDKVF